MIEQIRLLTHRFVVLTAFAVATAAKLFAFVGPGVAKADPVCGSPDVPCAGPSPLTPKQQCALTAWMVHMPCNWIGQQVPGLR